MSVTKKIFKLRTAIGAESPQNLGFENYVFIES